MCIWAALRPVKYIIAVIIGQLHQNCVKICYSEVLYKISTTTTHTKKGVLTKWNTNFETLSTFQTAKFQRATLLVHWMIIGSIVWDSNQETKNVTWKSRGVIFWRQIKIIDWFWYIQQYILYSKTFILTLKIHLIFLPKYGKTTPSDVIIYIRKISYMRLNIRDMYEIIQNFLPSKWNIRITDRSGAYMKYSLNINGLRLNYLKCAYSYKLLNIFIRLTNHVEFSIITIEKINLTSNNAHFDILR